MHADDVYTLESRKVALKLSMDERRHEIEVHRDSLRAELKLVRDDVHRCGPRACYAVQPCALTAPARLLFVGCPGVFAHVSYELAVLSQVLSQISLRLCSLPSVK